MYTNVPYVGAGHTLIGHVQTSSSSSSSSSPSSPIQPSAGPGVRRLMRDKSAPALTTEYPRVADCRIISRPTARPDGRTALTAGRGPRRCPADRCRSRFVPVSPRQMAPAPAAAADDAAHRKQDDSARRSGSTAKREWRLRDGRVIQNRLTSLLTSHLLTALKLPARVDYVALTCCLNDRR